MGPTAPQAGCAEMSRGEGGNGMAAAGGPPSPRTILIQMDCPLKGTAVSRLRECHCRFLLPGGPRCPPARGGQTGQASAALARPGPRAARRAPPVNKRAPRGSARRRRHVPRAPGTARQERACRRLQGGTAGWAPNTSTAAWGPQHRWLPRLGMPHGRDVGTTAGWSHTRCLPHQELAWAQPRCQWLGTLLQRDLALPTATAPRAKSNRHQPWEVHGRCGGTQPVSPKGPRGPFLMCHLVPAASAWPVPRGCAVCHGLCRAPRLCHAQGSPLVHQLLPVPVEPGRRTGGHGPGGLRRQPAQPRWARRLFLEEGGTPVSSSSSRARRGEGPARTALTKVRQRPGTSQWWPTLGTAAPHVQAG